MTPSNLSWRRVSFRPAITARFAIALGRLRAVAWRMRPVFRVLRSIAMLVLVAVRTGIAQLGRIPWRHRRMGFMR